MARPIRFLLNGEVHELSGVDPTLTVLNWLRYDQRLTGTKEGCAEGDCGACTVVLGELTDGQMQFRSANACIVFVPMLDGRALFTIEALKRETGLHPLQEALIDNHASQCGFCTPGFAMSLYAHQRAGGASDRASLEEALSGNLCRCTGYGAILAAGEAMGPDIQRSELAELTHALTGLQSEAALRVEYRKHAFQSPRTLDELAAAIETAPEATILAGGTDVGLWVTKQHRDLATIISINEVSELRRIEVLGDAIRIGAGVRYADATDALALAHPQFALLIRRIGGAQVRNLGTICGNIANGSPIGDMPPALIAAGATLVLRKGAARRELPLEGYFLDYGKQDRRPGEFIEAVIVPKLPAGRIFHVAKVAKRFEQDISAVCMGLSVELDGDTVTAACIAFGGMAAIPKRAAACEAALLGQAWTEAAVRVAAQAMDIDFQPITDARASSTYRLDVARNLLVRAVIDGQTPNVRLADLEAVRA